MACSACVCAIRCISTDARFWCLSMAADVGMMERQIRKQIMPDRWEREGEQQLGIISIHTHSS